MLNFEEIKQIPITEVVARYGVRLNLTQNGGSALCPLPTHKRGDKQKSFSVNAERNYWQCFSQSCNQGNGGKKGGDVINFVALMEGCQPRDAAEKLLDWFGRKNGAVHIEPPPATTAAPPGRRDSSHDRSESYLRQVDAWFDELVKRGANEDDATYWKRVRNGVKGKLIESFRNGKAAVAQSG